ncbi:coiled-coil domain-containing protein 83-like [Ylistrum balloti]|uniref:coiled-coil domain-containing protein 83-like n=1 Tax=Ylistrum balloti TaxID=509963 RepID=UPI002905A525|nr:coiled-coil domain-containing protein 83-like [Ylistrum balloti]XP_060063305.1 coiled-coil domain-containing protein 83-like [Ylistrum balloti]XP_060063306.1 coiled-coil domain-containing protein 83-like [Ylistrum balloti]XP_060063307.1 coiled-coil domain-containing protein 83-like [Ylistrum balloti]
MGKKKGKKGKGGGKKGGKKKEPQMTAKEAILAYQIGIVEKKLEDVMFESRGWEDKNHRHEERNEKLLSEQELLIKHLLKQAKEVEKYFENEEVKTRDDVIMTMKDKWGRQRQKENELTELKKRIAETEGKISREEKEVELWLAFRDKGDMEQKKQIQLLKDELVDMEISFGDMKNHLERSQEKATAEINQHTEETVDKQKYLASEKAIGQLDKYSRQEVLDNDWLRREVEIHKAESAELRKEVEDLEKANLLVMADLFECKIEDLKVSRNFFLTQFEEGGENLDNTGILEMDLAQISINDTSTDTSILAIKEAEETISARAGSATQRAVEKKVFSMAAPPFIEHDGDSSSEDDESVDTELLDNMYFEEEDFSDYLKLGPLEMKLLNVSGVQMPIHVPQVLSAEEAAAKDCKPDSWPVTHPMLRGVARP